MRTTIVLLLGTIVAVSTGTDAPKPSGEHVAFYEKEVLPLLQEHCFKCHSGKKLRGGLSLETRAAVLQGGDLGPAVLAGKLEDSPLLKAVRYTHDDLKMPPAGKLTAAQIAIVEKWAALGLPVSPGREGVAKAKPIKPVDDGRSWWAFQPLKRPALPTVKGQEWLATPIDAFVLAKLEEAGLRPAVPAERTALARRLYFGLTGLPPTPEQVDAFVNDARPDAYERLVDQLLASPAYGEKWGRHWLDLVRYAETHGYERDSAKPFAWRFRDWAVRAFNENRPYDQFVKEQLAGDVLRPDDAEALIATGYYRLGIWDDEPADRLLARYDVLDDVVSTTSSVFLGLSVGCARCHDHKKDPLPQKDYYRLLAYFNDITDMNRTNTRKVLLFDGAERERLLRDKQQREGRLYAQAHGLEQELLVGLAKKKGPEAAALIGSDMEGVTYRYYRDAWHELPDFEPLVPLLQGELASNRFSLSAAPVQETMALVFEGKLKVPVAGEHTFDLSSTDGARLIIDGKRVIDRPGKGKAARTATVTLRAGLLPIRLEYFNTTTRAELVVGWKGPGFERRLLTDRLTASRALLPDSRPAGQTWRYTTAAPGRGWMRTGFDDKSWKTGEGGFGTRGTPGAVVRTVWKTPDIWLRKTFTVQQVPAGLMLDVHHDEDVIVFVNGRRVFNATGFLRDYKRVRVDASVLKQGENLIAVHCKQTGGGQYIDVGLVGEGGTSLPDVVQKYAEELLGKEKAERLRQLRAELARVRAEKLPENEIEVMCVSERGSRPTRLLARGNPHAPGDEVKAGTPTVLGATREAKGAKRLALAEWVVARENPLTARVLANRIWQYHFGRGIVPTPNDFGQLGEKPTHPELLDWLAVELIENGWDLKHLHRLILRSATYRMSSKGEAKALAQDGANMLFWRFPMRRLTAEEVRDSVLSVSGQLNRQMGGPSVYPPIPAAVLAGQSVPGAGWRTSGPDQAARRSVYVHVKRSLLLPVLQDHDSADTDSSCPVRYTTTVPTQSLGMLNGEFTNEQAGLFAGRLLAETDDLSTVVRRVVRLTTGRVPKDAEVKADVAFIEKLRKEEGLSLRKAVASYCLLAINTNEFIYLD